MNRWVWMPGVALGFYAVGAAALTVIFDSGLTVPLPDQDDTTLTPQPAPQTPDGYPLTALFPVSTPSMRPGRSAVNRQRLAARLERLSTPLFLIGSDTLSLDWLARHRERLIALGAIGFLVEAKTAADFQTVLGVAGPDLIIVPGSAERLAGVLGLSHYPVLLSGEELDP